MHFNIAELLRQCKHTKSSTNKSSHLLKENEPKETNQIIRIVPVGMRGHNLWLRTLPNSKRLTNENYLAGMV